MIRINNFWKLDDFSLLYVTYAYVDHKTYLADSLFIQKSVRVKYKGEAMREDSPYCIVFCKVLKRDVALFEAALTKLKDKMLIFEHRDYETVCDEVNKMIEASG